METLAVVLQEPERLELSRLALTPPGEGDVVVDIAWSGISTGTEKLLWSGRMPPFPGMGYPLVPGYESVGRISHTSPNPAMKPGTLVFVGGATCFGPVRGLFGGAAARLVVPAARAIPIDEALGAAGVLLALAATAYHASPGEAVAQPDLIVGHGVVGRLLARLAVATGRTPPTVWETNPIRMSGAVGYQVLHPDNDPRRTYRAIYDASGDPTLLDQLISRLAPTGEIVLAGFYHERLSFSFPPAFMREARIRIAAQWLPSDLTAVQRLLDAGKLDLSGLITHHTEALEAPSAYRTAFSDPACLKMVLNWRHAA